MLYPFQFEAIDWRGDGHSGSLEASDEDDAARRLKERGFFVIHLSLPEESTYVTIRNLRRQAEGQSRCVIVVCGSCAKQLGATTEMSKVFCSHCGSGNRVVCPSESP